MCCVIVAAAMWGRFKTNINISSLLMCTVIPSVQSLTLNEIKKKALFYIVIVHMLIQVMNHRILGCATCNVYFIYTYISVHIIYIHTYIYYTSKFYIYTYIHIYTYMYVCIYVYIYEFMYVYCVFMLRVVCVLRNHFTLLHYFFFSVQLFKNLQKKFIFTPLVYTTTNNVLASFFETYWFLCSVCLICSDV